MIKGKRPQNQKKTDKASSQAKTKGSETKKTSSIFDNLGSSTSDIVKSAASILQDEIAKGVVAARQVEDAFEKITKTDKDQPYVILQRFRRDAHDILDIMLDMVGSSIGFVTNMSALTTAVEKTAANGSIQTDSKNKPESVTVGPVKKGSNAYGNFTITGMNPKEDKSVNISYTNFVSNTGEKIEHESIKFDTTRIIIRSAKPRKVTFSIAVPKECIPGTYAGVVQFSNEKLHPRIITCIVI